MGIFTRPAPPTTLRDELEAEARRLIAAHVQHGPPRGWDTQRAALARLAAIDQALDRWLEATH